MKRDQKGFTIVELLIAVAILSIVIASVCGFILVGSRSYAAGNSDINVQQEAQLALNQMSDVMIDTTRSVNYAGYDAGGTPVFALKDAEFAFTPEDKSLVMYNGVVEETVDPSGVTTKTVNTGNGNQHYHFYWSKSCETLYYAELDVQPGDVDTSGIHFPTFTTPDPDDPAKPDPPAGWVKLASHVTDFSVDLSQVEEKRVVQLALTFTDGKKQYVTSNNVTIRNKVGVNDAELEPLNRRKTISVAARDSGVIIEPGETYHFSTPRVTGENVTDRSVEWSVETSHSTSGGTKFTDKANGILQVASDEPAGDVLLKITTKAVGDDGLPATCPVTVHIKRVTAVNLSAANAEGTEINGAGNTVYLVSPGKRYTITADVNGYKLEEVCSVCGDDTTIDKQVIYAGNPFGRVEQWRVYSPKYDSGLQPGDPNYSDYDPREYASIAESKPNYAVLEISPNAPVGDRENNVPHGFVVQAYSLLSAQGNSYGRSYGWVPGAIEFRLVKGNSGAVPYKGSLKYGEQTLDESIREGLPTDYPKYLTAIRVVDNSGKMEDRILLHYTIGGGANYRICPDLFDLNLNGSYTFYIQAIFPVPDEGYVEGQGGTADDNETIRREYFGDIKGHTAEEGYTGTRYRHGKVYWAKLDRPRVTFCYKGEEYQGKNIIYDTVNVYSGDRLIEKIEPRKLNGQSPYENIEGNEGMNGMVYSLYKEEEGQSAQKSIYYYDENTMSYQGSKTFGDGAVSVNPGGDPFMKVNDQSKRLNACGDYHIVPGMLYQNKAYDHYEIVGYEGFDYDNLERKLRYYKFDESTIHVKIDAKFTMRINDDWFQGQVNFPLPKEILKNPTLFPNPYDMAEKSTTGPLKAVALKDGSQQGEYKTFAYVNYRYISKPNDRWEVEPVEIRFDTQAKKKYIHSYGTYVCEENGTEWEKTTTKGSKTTEEELVCNVKPFSVDNNNDYQAFFPLPGEAGFPFAGGAEEMTGYELDYFDDNMQYKDKVSDLTVTCEKNGDAYTIQFVKKEKNKWNNDDHRIKVTSYGTYVWTSGETMWKRTDALGNRVTYETDFVPTLKDLKLPDGKTYMMAYPLPTESDFRFKYNGEVIQCNDEKAYDQINDTYAADVKSPFNDYTNRNIEAKYTVTGSTHTIQFYRKEKVNPSDANNHKLKTTTYGIYDWTSGSDSWSLRPGSAGKEEDSTDFVPTLFITINGTDYKMHFPLPTESDFDQCMNGMVSIGSWNMPLYEKDDDYAERPDTTERAKIKCTKEGNAYKLTICSTVWPYPETGDTFTCPENGKQWTKVKVN